MLPAGVLEAYVRGDVPMRAQIRARLEAASVPLLIMCLAQITGDSRWLEAPFRPHRDRRLFHDESGGLPEQIQHQVREAMADVLVQLSEGRLQIKSELDEEQMRDMMRVCVAEDIPPEYVPLAMEEMGFRSRDFAWSSPSARSKAALKTALVIGAGASGICAAIKLRALGFRCIVVERNFDVGGVWLENDYPQAGVDTPNQFYSYSFAPNSQWSSCFSKRDEVLAYFRGLAQARIEGDLRLSTTVKRLDWDEAASSWRVSLINDRSQPESLIVDFVVSAVGQMNQPKMPDIAGIERFSGEVFHSARWRHDVSLRGKQVVVVGAGASAMQLVPTVAAQAARMTLIQRSAQWVLPLEDYHRKVSLDTQWVLETVPFYLAWYRFGLFWRFSDAVLSTLRRDPEWPHPERSVNAANDRNRRMMTDYLLDKLEGRPDLIEKLLPTYPPYTKRILIDNRWFDTLRQPHVRVVNAGVDRFEHGGIVDQLGQEHAADVVILATGFDAARMLNTVQICGRDGRLLEQVWGDDDPRAYLGITVPGFPNFFCMYGPNGNLGHGGSAIFQLECQIRYISGCLKKMVEEDVAVIDVRREVHDRYNSLVDAEHGELVWSHPGTTNWFRNRKGRIFSIMPWRMVDYWRMTHDPDFSDYQCDVGAVHE